MDDRVTTSRPVTPDQSRRPKTPRTPKTGNDMQRVTHGLWAKLEKVKSLEAKYPELKGTESAPQSPVEKKVSRKTSVGRDAERSMSVGGQGKGRSKEADRGSRREEKEVEVKAEGRVKRAHHGSRKEEHDGQVLAPDSTPWWSWRRSPPAVQQPEHPQQSNPQHFTPPYDPQHPPQYNHQHPPQYNPQHPPQYNPQESSWHYNPQLPPPPYNPQHPAPSNVHREDSPDTECEEFRKHCWNCFLPSVSWLFWTSIAVVLALVRWGWWTWMSVWPPLAKTIWKRVGMTMWKTEWRKGWKQTGGTARKMEWKNNEVKKRDVPPAEAIPPVVKEKKTQKPRPKPPHPERQNPPPPPATPQPHQLHQLHQPHRPTSRSGSLYLTIPIAILALIIAFLLQLRLCRIRNPNLPPSPDQPVDTLIHATHTIASALEPLTDTAQWQVYSKLAACEFVEAAANVSSNPFQYDVFRQARKKGGSGWGCPSPNMPDVHHPDENLARLGLKLAVEMRTIQTLLRRSSSSSLAAARAAVHIATRIQTAALDSNTCRLVAPKTSSLLFPCLSPPLDPTLPALNAALADLNSTLTSFAESQIELLTALEDAATNCQDHLAEWKDAKPGEVRKIRGVWLRDRAEAICGRFAKKVERRIVLAQLRRERDVMEGILEARIEMEVEEGEESEEEGEEEEEVTGLMEARWRLVEALGVLREVGTTDKWQRRDEGGGFDWVGQLARVPPVTTTIATAATTSKELRRRCGVLGAPLSPNSSGPDEDGGREDGREEGGREEQHAAVGTTTILQTIREMEKSARLAGRLVGVQERV